MTRRPVSAALVALVVSATTLAGCSSRSTATGGPAASSSAVSSSPAAPAVPSPTVSPAPSGPGSRRPAPRAARPAVIPAVSARARAAGLVDVRTIVPDALVNPRYATASNFTHVRLYPLAARCLVHRTMSRGLATAAAYLHRRQLLMVFWDCYRPHAVQVRMFRIVSNPDWVARPGPYARSHEAGRSVDITLARASMHHACAQRVRGHCLLNMGTGFDNFATRAHAFATTGVSARARYNRALMRRALSVGGIAVYSGEWWHFDGPGAGVNRPHLDAPVY